MECRNLILLHGIQQRSGTNYINKLICLHPECRQPSIKVRESWFLDNSNQLKAYGQSMLNRWQNPKWGGDSFEGKTLYHCIGKGLIEFLSQNMKWGQENERLVTKTPSVKNIADTELLFPQSKNVILVRDPRDVAESARKTWNKPIDISLSEWIQASIEIMHFERRGRASSILIRYEDFLSDCQTACKKMLEYLKLDISRYPFDQVDNQPLLGSSTTEGVWKSIPRNKEFKGYGRWQHWPEEVIQKVNTAIEPYLFYFGYKTDVNLSPVAALPSYEDRIKFDLPHICPDAHE